MQRKPLNRNPNFYVNRQWLTKNIVREKVTVAQNQHNYRSDVRMRGEKKYSNTYSTMFFFHILSFEWFIAIVVGWIPSACVLVFHFVIASLFQCLFHCRMNFYWEYARGTVHIEMIIIGEEETANTSYTKIYSMCQEREKWMNEKRILHTLIQTNINKQMNERTQA